MKDTYINERGIPLVCSGCAHSISNAEFPGFPSGERPCFLCIRNIKREEWQEEHKKMFGEILDKWYGNAEAIKIPMDCYHTCDMKSQFIKWKDWDYLCPLIDKRKKD